MNGRCNVAYNRNVRGRTFCTAGLVNHDGSNFSSVCESNISSEVSCEMMLISWRLARAFLSISFEVQLLSCLSR